MAQGYVDDGDDMVTVEGMTTTPARLQVGTEKAAALLVLGALGFLVAFRRGFRSVLPGIG